MLPPDLVAGGKLVLTDALEHAARPKGAFEAGHAHTENPRRAAACQMTQSYPAPSFPVICPTFRSLPTQCSDLPCRCLRQFLCRVMMRELAIAKRPRQAPAGENRLFSFPA